MSIKCENSRGWVLDHLAFTKETYCNVNAGTLDVNKRESRFSQYSMNGSLFEIITPFFNNVEAINAANSNRLKRKKSLKKSLLSDESPEVYTIKSVLEEVVHLSKKSGHFTQIPEKEDFSKNNEEARHFSTMFYNEISTALPTNFSGGNTSETPIIVNISNQEYLIPKCCKFFCCDVAELKTKLPELSEFNFILLDPPWWNKYIRRRKAIQESAGYQMMYNDQVCLLPIRSWLDPEGLVAVWCTNSPTHIKDITSRWFPQWRLKHVATWYWIKVTQSGEPVCQFSPPPGKQPYERIIFGIPETRQAPPPPDQLCIVSVPSAIHSHKPPLSDVIKSYLPPHPRCLELFARYLLPHWTSVGDQVLALQNIKLFSPIKEFTSYK